MSPYPFPKLRIVESEQTIAWRRADIAKLERSGCDTEPDRELLSEFERLLELQIADRDWLVKKLASYDVLQGPVCGRRSRDDQCDEQRADRRVQGTWPKTWT